MRTSYESLIDRQRKEFNDLPITYAFGGKDEINKAVKRLGANDISECCTIFDHGDIVKKVDKSKVLETMKQHDKELREAMKDDNFAYEAFLYEMDNHEYAINWSGDEDVLGCFGMTVEDLRALGLQCIYETARREHMRKAHEEWGII